MPERMSDEVEELLQRAAAHTKTLDGPRRSEMVDQMERVVIAYDEQHRRNHTFELASMDEAEVDDEIERLAELHPGDWRARIDALSVYRERVAEPRAASDARIAESDRLREDADLAYEREVAVLRDMLSGDHEWNES